MKKIITLFSIVLLLVLTACDSSEIYSDHQTFSDILWHKTDTPQFTVDLKNEQHCQLKLDLRLIYGYTFRNIKMNVSMNNETGKEKIIPIDFKVRNEDDSYKGDMMGDFIDIQEVVIKDTILPAGKYTFILEQMMDDKTLPFVNEVGLVLVDLDKK